MKRIDRIGEKYFFEDGTWMEIFYYNRIEDIGVLFSDGTKVYNKQYCKFKIGGIKNKNKPNVYGIGFIGFGNFKVLQDKKAYSVWCSLLERSYSSKTQNKQPSYKGCSVALEWHNFQVFAEWFYLNYKEGFEIDKDIIKKGNKVYGPETCFFVPKEVNLLLVNSYNENRKNTIGVVKRKDKFIAQYQYMGKMYNLGMFINENDAFYAYKIKKEEYIKFIANKFKSVLNPICYELLMNWTIEIND